MRNVTCPGSEGLLVQKPPCTDFNDECVQLESYKICFKNSYFLSPPAHGGSVCSLKNDSLLSKTT